MNYSKLSVWLLRRLLVNATMKRIKICVNKLCVCKKYKNVTVDRTEE